MKWLRLYAYLGSCYKNSNLCWFPGSAAFGLVSSRVKLRLLLLLRVGLLEKNLPPSTPLTSLVPLTSSSITLTLLLLLTLLIPLTLLLPSTLNTSSASVRDKLNIVKIRSIQFSFQILNFRAKLCAKMSSLDVPISFFKWTFVSIDPILVHSHYLLFKMHNFTWHLAVDAVPRNRDALKLAKLKSQFDLLSRLRKAEKEKNPFWKLTI